VTSIGTAVFSVYLVDELQVADTSIFFVVIYIYALIEWYSKPLKAIDLFFLSNFLNTRNCRIIVCCALVMSTGQMYGLSNRPTLPSNHADIRFDCQMTIIEEVYIYIHNCRGNLVFR
jgi:hypothetical protein